jgi:O-antigen/teichoic acid export membrane protein
VSTPERRQTAVSAGQAAVSQGLSAASNFVILLALARGGGSHVVGEFALAFVVYNATLGFQRAVVSDALLARVAATPDGGREADACAATSSVLLSLSSALVVLIIGLATSYQQLTLLAVFIPPLLLEDLYRFLLFRRGRTGAAIIVDGTWVLVSCLSLPYLVTHASPHAAILIWGCGGTAACIVGGIVAGARFARPAPSYRWWREHLWCSSRWLTLEATLFHIDQQVQAFGFLAIAGSAAFGHWRLALALLGLAVFIDAGVRIVGVTHLSRHTRDHRTAVQASAVSAAFTLALTAVVLVAEPVIVPLLYGDRVHVPRSVILICGIYLAASSAATGPLSVLRGQQRERPMPVARAVSLIVFTPLALLAARHDFEAGLWIITAGAVTYTAIVSWAAFATANAPHPEVARTPVADELPA